MINVNLLRAKMAEHGDFNENDLCNVIDASPMQVHRRMIGEVYFKPPEIKKIAEHYELSDSEVTKIFNIGADNNEDSRSSASDEKIGAVC